MAEPKYYADDKAILDEMIRLEKEREEALAMGLLGAGTIGLDAAGLKALGTMGRIIPKTPIKPPDNFMPQLPKDARKQVFDATQTKNIDPLKLYQQQQRGYSELAAATIPFAGGIDMLNEAYQNYMVAQSNLDRLTRMVSPEEKAEFDKKLKEERMKPYQLKDSDFRYK